MSSSFTEITRTLSSEDDREALRQQAWDVYIHQTQSGYPRKLARTLIEWTNTDDIFGKTSDERAQVIFNDIGCGSGHDSSYFAYNGYKVNAIDYNETSINVVKEMQASRITPIKMDFTENPMPKCHVAYANYVMSFIPPEKFITTWKNHVVSQILPNGIYVGNFFGPKHEWYPDPYMSFFNKQQVEELFEKDFKSKIVIKEKTVTVKTADNGQKLFHTLKVVAEKKDEDSNDEELKTGLSIKL
jgi:hypothetical protein